MLCPLYIGLGLKCGSVQPWAGQSPLWSLTCAPVKRANDIEVTRLLLGWNEAVEVNMPWKLVKCIVHRLANNPSSGDCGPQVWLL